MEDFEAVHDELLLIGIDEELARRSGDVADQFGLRGYDAVHLACAQALGEATTLVTWDEDLRQAAADSGFAVAPAG